MKAGGSLWGQSTGAKENREEELVEAGSTMGETYSELISEIGKVVAGQHEAVEQMLISIFTRSHALLEDTPASEKPLWSTPSHRSWT